MRVACEHGHKQIFYTLLEYGQFNIDITLALAGACYGHRRIANYPKMIIMRLCEKLNYGNNFNKMDTINCALYEASYSNLTDIVELLLNKANELKIKYDIAHVIRGATLGNHRELIKQYVLSKPTLLTIGYYEAAYKGDKELILWYEQNYKIYNSEAYLTGLKQSGRIETMFDKERYRKETICKWSVSP